MDIKEEVDEHRFKGSRTEMKKNTNMTGIGRG